MNHLVFLDTKAGELEKILSGMKTMVIKEFDPARSAAKPVQPGDSLYFLRDNDECILRVKATVVRIYPFWKSLDENLSQILKEMQAKLQFTENQYEYWSSKDLVLFVEFGSARKIPVVHIALNRIKDRSGWIDFDELNLIKKLSIDPKGL